MSAITELKRIWGNSLETSGGVPGRGAMPTADFDRLKRDWPGGLDANSGGNRNFIAWACCALCGRTWPWASDSVLGDVLAHRGDWAPSHGKEDASPEYSGWRAGALGSLLSEGEWWEANLPWLVAHALSAGPVPTKTVVVGFNKKAQQVTSERVLNGDQYTEWLWGSDADYSILPAPRMLWSVPVDNSTLLYKAPAHPLMSLACGKSIRVPNWTHPNYGLPLQAILRGKTSRPSEWGPALKSGEDAVKHLGDLPPLPSTLSWHWRWYTNGTRAMWISHGRTGTRGTIVLAIWTGNFVTYYTAWVENESGGGGPQSSCRLEGTNWVVESSAAKLPPIPEPGDTVRTAVDWDKSGARQTIGGEPVKIPYPVQETTDGLLSFDVAGRKMAAQDPAAFATREKRLRTTAEVMRRITEDTTASALKGAETLVADMKRDNW